MWPFALPGEPISLQLLSVLSAMTFGGPDVAAVRDALRPDGYVSRENVMCFTEALAGCGVIAVRIVTGWLGLPVLDFRPHGCGDLT